MNFTAAVNGWVDQARRRLRVTDAHAKRTLFRAVTLGTPVDTGRALGNMAPSNHVMPDGADEFRFDPTGAATLARIDAVTAAGFGAVTYLSNGLDYVWDLEYGSSRQSPEGMFRVNALNWPRIVADAIQSAKQR